MSDSLFSLLRTAVRNDAKFSASITASVSRTIDHGDKCGFELICDCAEQIDKAFPVRKDNEGKDDNKEERARYFSKLRMALGRAGKSRPIPVRLTIKKIEGTYIVSVSDIMERGNNIEGTEIDLSDAVQTVIDNLNDPSVLDAIRKALHALSNSAD